MKHTAFRAGNRGNALKTYYIILLIFLILLPLVILSVLYSIIISQLRRVKSTSIDVRKRLREDAKVIKKIIAIIVVYILCLAPISVFIVLYLFLWKSTLPCGAPVFEFISYFLLFSNSALNPLVYFTFNERYRQELRSIVTRTLSLRSEDSINLRRPPTALTTSGGKCSESAVWNLEVWRFIWTFPWGFCNGKIFCHILFPELKREKSTL